MSKADEKVARAPSPEHGSTSDRDAMLLADMGYTQDLKRNFSIWSVLGVGFSLTNSWFGMCTALVAGISSGGPMLLIYGIPVITFVSACVGISLSELASAMPNSGGQYFWANELAPPRYARFPSYLTGWFAWAGSIFSTTSTTLGVATAVVGCYQLSHPDFTIETWHIIVCFELMNFVLFFFNCFGKVLPALSQLTLYISLVSFMVILITVPAKAETHQDAKFVFATFINSTGWSNSGIAFLVGLINPNWAFACLDCATHMAEEVARPEKVIPIAIMGTVAIAFTTSWFFCISMFFSLSNWSALLDTPTGTPILEVFYQALSNRAGAIVLDSLVILTGCGCIIAGHTWQSRLCWSFARDKGLPAHSWLAKVQPTLDVPLNAHFVSCFLVGALGLLYLGSSTAFNSMASACIVLLYVSYSIPVACLLLKGRNNIEHGPFWLGTIGLTANIVLIAWTVFTLVIFSLPSVMPATADTMNYISAVYAVVVVIIIIDWYARGRKQYRSRENREEGAALERKATHEAAAAQ